MASGAESAHGALYRAADAIWALKCLDAHDAKLEKVNRRIQNFDKDQCESDLGRAAVSLASAAAPSNGFGWDPIVVVGKCLASVNAIGSPAPELVDAMASLVPPGADQSLFALVTTLREKSLVAADKEKSKGTSGKELGNDGGAVLAAAERDRSRFIASVTEAVGKVACGGAVAAASAVASCPSVVFGDAIAHVAGRAARDSLAVGAESVPSTAAAKWWAANFHEAVLDPFDDALSADGVPGGRARDPLPRLLGLEPEPKQVPPRLDRVRLDQMTWATSPRAATPPNARAAVEVRIAEANEAAIAGRECVFTTPKRVRAGVGATGVAPQTPLDHAAASIRKEAASLRVSLSSAVQADAAAAAACFVLLCRDAGMRVSNEPHDDDDDGSEKNSFVTCDFRSLGGARSFRASVGSAYHSVPNSPHGLNSVPTTPGWYAGGARGDDETPSRENDDDDDFFDSYEQRRARHAHRGSSLRVPVPTRECPEPGRRRERFARARGSVAGRGKRFEGARGPKSLWRSRIGRSFRRAEGHRGRFAFAFIRRDLRRSVRVLARFRLRRGFTRRCVLRRIRGTRGCHARRLHRARTRTRRRRRPG